MAATPEEAFGQALRSARLAQGLSQERLAHRAGYHRTYVGLVERGRTSASIGAIFALAGALKISPSQLVRDAEQRRASSIGNVNGESS